MVNLATIERNYHFIEQRMRLQADISLRFGEALIDDEFKGGLGSIILGPSVKMFYSFYAKKNLKAASMKQLYVVLNTAKTLLLDGKKPEDPEFTELIATNARDYIRNDSTVLYCKKSHRNFRRLIENTKEGFAFQVNSTWVMLQVEDDVDGYTALCHKVFQNRERAREAMQKQMSFMDKGIGTVESDDTILDVPVGKSLILRVLRNGFEQTRAQFLRDIDVDYAN